MSRKPMTARPAAARARPDPIRATGTAGRVTERMRAGGQPDSEKRSRVRTGGALRRVLAGEPHAVAEVLDPARDVQGPCVVVNVHVDLFGNGGDGVALEGDRYMGGGYQPVLRVDRRRPGTRGPPPKIWRESCSEAATG